MCDVQKFLTKRFSEQVKPIKPLSNMALRQPSESDVAGYAQLKGRLWSMTLTKLYCIIGRAPYHYNC